MRWFSGAALPYAPSTCPVSSWSLQPPGASHRDLPSSDSALPPYTRPIAPRLPALHRLTRQRRSLCHWVVAIVVSSNHAAQSEAYYDTAHRESRAGAWQRRHALLACWRGPSSCSCMDRSSATRPSPPPALLRLQNLIFRFLQSRQKIQIWLYEHNDLRIEGRIIVSPPPARCPACPLSLLSASGHARGIMQLLQPVWCAHRPRRELDAVSGAQHADSIRLRAVSLPGGCSG